MEFLLPPITNNQDKTERRVGFEIEFGGLGLDEAAQIIQNLYGGKIHKKHQFAFEIKDAKFGTFEVESDSRFLSQKKYDEYLRKMGVSQESSLNENIEKFFEKFAGTLVPFEIAMPPIPLSQLGEAEKLRVELYRHSAQGISSSVFAAFGMQFNPEVPDFKPETLLSYLRSFFLLYDWLVEESQIVIARKIAPYINPFPDEYVELVLNPEYHPDLKELMMDYLKHNPTRNRPLDLLPLFAHLNSELLFRYPVESTLIKPRPTFHYRLPNSEIDDPDWSFAKEWNKWVEVERLAADPIRILQMSRDYFQFHDHPKIFVRSPWILRTREWIGAQV